MSQPQTNAYNMRTGVTALAGGGQGGAAGIIPPLQFYTLVSTVANANDSVTLPAAPVLGQVYYIRNGAAANSMDVFPPTGGTINRLAINTQFAQTAGVAQRYVASDALTYFQI